MKNFFIFIIITILFLINSYSQEIKYNDSWGDSGLKLLGESNNGVRLNFSINSFILNDVQVNGSLLKSVSLPNVFLPNDAGKPDLPGFGRFIAIPKNSEVEVKIIKMRTETIENIDIAPAPVLPLDSDPTPLKYEKDLSVYSSDEYYPSTPIKISEKTLIRGVDAVILGITPFQYNPVKKELKIYRDMEIQINFIGGTEFGGNEFRSRWWEPILSDVILNYNSLPKINFDERSKYYSSQTGYEYVIIIPNGPDFAKWADSIKVFRNEQGIKTGIFKLSDIGGNTVDQIKNWINNAYNTWQIKPAAICLMADYGSDPNSTIISKLQTHPSSYPAFASDNYYADVNGDEMPDIVFSRIVANNNSELETIISRQLDYERTPPTSENFYSRMITALGWQTERWFQLCSEAVGGFFQKRLFKEQIRINAIYSGTPGTVWSTATNTNTVVNYFGPNGRGYIPSRPDSLGGWTGGTATMINAAINQGAFLLVHRDHGLYTGWGEPYYRTTNISALTNNELPFIYSINCQTGAYHNPSGSPANATFVEVFIKHKYNNKNAGAVGLVCPTEVSYSFVNDTYVWGNLDNMFPNFLPDYGTTPPSRDAKPAFGMAAGKYFLLQSSWPYNTSDKLVTYRLFHMHGDAFLNLYYDYPSTLTISHPISVPANTNQITVTANIGAFIALSVDGNILATATGAGEPVTLTFNTPLAAGQKLKIVATKQNFRRYSAEIDVVGGSQTTCKDVSVYAGWNIVSVPVSSNNMANNSLFPTAVSQAYHYQNGYFTADTLKNGVGYWLKFTNNENIQVCGTPLNFDSITVKTGWNLIGTLGKNVPVTNISSSPSNIINSPFYGFDNIYNQATELLVGKGYWVKASQDGILYFNQSLNKNIEKNNTEKLSTLNNSIKLVITDNVNNSTSLYLTDKQENLDYYELPPLPPMYSFDCRFSDNKSVRKINDNENYLKIYSSNYPVKIKVIGGKLNIQDLVDGSFVNKILDDGEELIINISNIQSFKLIAVNNFEPNFALEQNYPNPFNPSTVIKYSIAEKGLVKLNVYDILGREIKELVNEVKDKGSYSVNFNASDIPSGVYFYKLISGNKQDIKKMILQK